MIAKKHRNGKKKQRHEKNNTNKKLEWDQESSSDTDFKWKWMRNRHINEERDIHRAEVMTKGKTVNKLFKV